MKFLSVLGAVLCAILIWFTMYNETVYDGDITREMSLESFVDFFDSSANNEKFAGLINFAKEANKILNIQLPEPQPDANFFVKALLSFANTVLNIIELPLRILIQVITFIGYILRVIFYFLTPFVSYF